MPALSAFQARRFANMDREGYKNMQFFKVIALSTRIRNLISNLIIHRNCLLSMKESMRKPPD